MNISLNFDTFEGLQKAITLSIWYILNIPFVIE